MKFLHRLGYYLGGFSLGLIVLAFFLSGKKTSCDYMPESRVLKNLKHKSYHVAPNLTSQKKAILADSAFVKQLFINGTIDFDLSEPRKLPCGIYHLNSEVNHKQHTAKVKNCDSLITFLTFE